MTSALDDAEVSRGRASPSRGIGKGEEDGGRHSKHDYKRRVPFISCQGRAPPKTAG